MPAFLRWLSSFIIDVDAFIAFLMWCVLLYLSSRRPEGKFKKKQTPRDEALQILKPQMDKPPVPQVRVRAHSETRITGLDNATQKVRHSLTRGRLKTALKDA